MRRFILFLVLSFALSFQNVYPANAPVTSIGDEVSYTTTSIVPISVSNFTQIGSCEFILNFDPGKISISSVSLGPGVSSYYFLEGEVSPGVYKITWMFFQYGVPGLSLADDAVFMNIHVIRETEGYSPIKFDTTASQNCLYTDYDYNSIPIFPNGTYFYNGSISFASDAVQWNGNIDDDWSNPLNWDADVPGPASMAIIDNVATNPYPNAISGAECLGLEIAPGASLNIPANCSLTVYGNLINDGLLIIQSNSSGSGSFINFGKITGAGSATIERYLVEEAWHYLSSPISNGLSGILANIYLKQYIEPAGGWEYIVSLNEPLHPMKGFACWASDAYTGPVTTYFSGSLNYNTQTTGTLTNTPGYESSGYNLVGNPYASAVDWDIADGWSKTNLNDAFYIFNGENGNYGSYVNGSGLNGVTNHIPAFQGFFVKVTNEFSTGSLSIHQNAREHHSQPFLNSPSGNVDGQVLRLATSSAMNAYSDEVLLLINSNSTNGFDHQYDAYKLPGYDDAPQLFTNDINNEMLSVNCFPMASDVITIPTSFKAGLDGLYSIEATELSNFENETEIFLEDKFDNVWINLKEDNLYNFFANADDIPGRFNIHFHFNPAGISQPGKTTNCHIYSNRNVIVIESLSDKTLNGQIQVYNLLGQQIIDKEIFMTNHLEFELDNKGFFLVAYFNKANNSQVVRKVRIK